MKGRLAVLLMAAFAGAAPGAAAAGDLAADFVSPPSRCRPETWFHFVDGNVSREGVTADLEAIAAAGIGGIQFFHGGMGGNWPGVTNPVYCLSREWDGCVRFVADECRRLGLTFKMQNCPGWSMAGGPWITLDNTMRDLVWSQRTMQGPCAIETLELALAEGAGGADHDYRDIVLAAFPAPEGTELLKPAEMQCVSAPNGLQWRAEFAEPFTVRTLVLPSVESMSHAWCYEPGVTVRIRADGREVGKWKLPQSNWQDNQPLSLAVPETTASVFDVELECAHYVKVPFVRLDSTARPHNWESESARCLRAVMHDPDAPASLAAFVDPDAVRVAAAGAKLELGEGRWMVLRIGHVNKRRRNGPAPREAVGWECDKLSPRGIEANFAGYIGRLAGKGGPLEGRLDGMLLDSWECQSQTWTAGFDAVFEKERGYALDRWWPALCGFVVRDRAETRRFLRDWRTLVGETMAENFYGRMGALAHAAGLTVAFETASGDVFPGDIMSYYKYADTPMCEFWQPRGDSYVGSESFKPVRPCASAAHLYGKPRVDAESLTSFSLTWDETLRFFKPYVDRHFALGVTHNVFHTYTHNPQIGFLPPGTSFGSGIGSPFLRGQTWWRHMRAFTDCLARCTMMLERGRWRADVLLYLGDEQDHKPPQRLTDVPDGYRYDYANPDVLHHRLTVKDGRLVTPEGLSYAVLWIRPNTFLSERTRRRLAEFAGAGVTVCGPDAKLADVLSARLKPDLVATGEGARPQWCHRTDGDTEIYFVAACDGPFTGVVTLPRLSSDGDDIEVWDPTVGQIPSIERAEECRTANSAKLTLAEGESRFLVKRPNAPQRTKAAPERTTDFSPKWTVAYVDAERSAGVAPFALAKLVPWCEFPVGAEARAYSGSVVYTAVLPAGAFGDAAEPLALDLGRVESVASVCVNGVDIGTRWCAPYRFELTDAARRTLERAGESKLEIEVTGTWFNRLVYDQGLPEKDRKTWTIRPPKKDVALRASGLLGPVKLVGRAL